MNLQDRNTRRMEIENDLQYRLNNVIEKIKNRAITDTGQAQNLFSTEVNRTIRAAVEDSYQLGIDYVTSKRRTVGFLTSSDLKIIQDQTAKYSIKFWIKVDRVIHRNDVLLQTRNYEPRSPLNSNYLATVTAVAIVTTTMAMAVQQKAVILQSSLRSGAIKKKKKKKIVTPIADEQFDNQETDILTDILTVAPLALTSLMVLNQDDPYGEVSIDSTDTGGHIVLQWNAILDNKTCQVCESLDGTTWQPDDPMLPTPGDEGDIHDNCRCQWEIIEELF